MKIYLHLLNHLMELVHKLLVLLLDNVDMIEQNHLHMFRHLHDLFVVARKQIKNQKYCVLFVKSL
jgi:hypothetical protein